jgi:hypothetical protein
MTGDYRTARHDCQQIRNALRISSGSGALATASKSAARCRFLEARRLGTGALLVPESPRIAAYRRDL